MKHAIMWLTVLLGCLALMVCFVPYLPERVGAELSAVQSLATCMALDKRSSGSLATNWDHVEERIKVGGRISFMMSDRYSFLTSPISLDGPLAGERIIIARQTPISRFPFRRERYVVTIAREELNVRRLDEREFIRVASNARTSEASNLIGLGKRHLNLSILVLLASIFGISGLLLTYLIIRRRRQRLGSIENPTTGKSS
jgi:hypothetical protein